MKSLSRKRIISAAAAVLLTGMYFSVLVSAQPGESGRPRTMVVEQVMAKGVSTQTPTGHAVATTVIG